MPATYTWYKDNNVIAGESAATYVVTTSGTYAVSVVSSHGCASPLSAALAFAMLPRPNTPTIVASGETSFCAGGKTELQAVVMPPAEVYIWYKDDSMVASGHLPKYMASENGTYTVSAIAGNGCESAEKSAGQEVNVIDYPETPVLAGAPRAVVRWLYPLPVPNPLEVVSPATGVSYQWFQNDVALPMERSWSLYFSPVSLRHEGIYRVKVTALTADCTAESENMQLVVDTKIFAPNILTPNGDGHNDAFVIQEPDLYVELDLLIVNRWGNEVFRMKRYDGSFTGAGLSDGTYFYSIRALGRDGMRITQAGYVMLKH
jgi:gliding motility-associated-like protein